MNKLYKCSKCGYQMIKGEVWVANDAKSMRVFCYTHAPESAIRLKDTMFIANKLNERSRREKA